MTFPYSRIQSMLIDLDGVLYRGNAPLPSAQQFVQWLRDRDITFRLVTNNATLTPGQYVDKLAAMGIVVGQDEVFTSALATALYLQERNAGGEKAFVIGEGGLLTALNHIGINQTVDRPDWVIVGLDRQVTYDKLATAALALESGARFLATNPDTSLPTEAGLVPGAGAIQAALIAATGKHPVVVGKPQPIMLELAMKALDRTVANTAMLGDRLETDIQAADSLDMASILVLTGVSTRADLEVSSIQPTLVVDSLAQLMERWQLAG